MKLTMTDFMNTFKAARMNKAEFIFVGIKKIDAKGIMITTIPSASYDEKEKFYKCQYNDDLVNVMYEDCRIFAWTYGDATLMCNLLEGKAFPLLKGGEMINGNRN